MTKQHNDEQHFPGNEPEVKDVDQDAAEAETATEAAEAENEARADESQNELERLQAERDSYFDQLQRSVAEFANYRRRNDQERSQLASMVRKDVISQFLPVIDDFERAMAQVPDDEQSTGWVTGLTMIESKFKGILERADVTPIDPVGEFFDPAKHEAVATEPGTTGSTVVEVYQKGYSIGDLLVRPAMVKTGDPVEADA